MKKYGKKKKNKSIIILEITLFVVVISLGVAGFIYYKNKEDAEAEKRELETETHEVIEVYEPIPYEIKEKYSKEMFNDKYSLLALYYLGANIYVEAKYQSDYKQRAVGSVALNRVSSPNFANNLIDVFEQYGQYAGMIEGTARRIIEIFENNEPISEELFLELERCIENAEWLLENGSILDEEYVFQAMFKQGYDCIYIEGDWFGKEKRNDI